MKPSPSSTRPSANTPGGKQKTSRNVALPTFFNPIQTISSVKPSTIMQHTDRLATAATSYFNFIAGPNRPPTFEGLALAVGFNSFAQMRKAILNESHPRPSRDVLIMACAHLADTYQQNGLLETLNPAFIKYLLSAYLNISEKHIAETTSENTFTIKWEPPPDKGLPQAAPSRDEIRSNANSTTALAAELRTLELEELM